MCVYVWWLRELYTAHLIYLTIDRYALQLEITGWLKCQWMINTIDSNNFGELN